MMKSYSKAVILDLDGVIIKWTGYHTIDPASFYSLGITIKETLQENGNFFILTNRPPAEMQMISYFLGIKEGYWVTESGGSIYNVKTNTVVIPEQWQIYANTYVPQLRQLLENKLAINKVNSHFDSAQYYAPTGLVRTLILPALNSNKTEFARNVRDVIESSQLKGLFQVTEGKAIDIDPVGLSKKEGMKILLDNNSISPYNIPVIFIADHRRDIPAAELLLSEGGMIGAVANAEVEFKEFVKDNKGIIAEENTSFHSSVVSILHTFNSR